MKTITIEAIRDIASGSYLTYSHPQGWGCVSLPDNAYPTPSSLVGTTANPDIFSCDHNASSYKVVSDSELASRIIERGDYTEEEWIALSEMEREDAIDAYVILVEEDGAEVCERNIEYQLLTFAIDDAGTIQDSRVKTVTYQRPISSFRAVMGEKLQEFRTSQGLSVYKVSRQGGIRIDQVNAVESGLTNYTIDIFLGYVRGCNLYLYFATKDGSKLPHDLDNLIRKGRENLPS